MLKLLKVEFKQYTLSYLLIFLGFFVLAFAVPVIHRNTDIVFISFILQTLFVLLAIVIVAGVFINSARAWINSLFKRSGYLTFTLPINTHQIILSKTGASLFWTIISLIVVVAGTFIMVLTSMEPGLDIILEMVRDLFSTLLHIICTYPLEALSYLAGLLGAITNLLLTLYMCLTFTHTSWVRRHRIVIAISLFFLIQIFSGNIIINGESYSLIGMFNKFVIYDYPSYFQTETMRLFVSGFLQWLQCLIPYAIIWFCLEKKLEI